MRECGADTTPIHTLLEALRNGRTVSDALDAAGASAAEKNFVETTMKVATSGEAHRIAAAFSFGREDIIPQMFQSLVESLAQSHPDEWSTLRYYLDRHITADADKHGPMAQSLATRLCGSDPLLQQEAEQSARASLQARIELWDEILMNIRLM